MFQNTEWDVQCRVSGRHFEKIIVGNGHQPDVRRNRMKPNGMSEAALRFRRKQAFAADAINSKAVIQLR